MPTPINPPTRPPSKGPNPFILIGMVVASSLAFYTITEKRKNDPRERDRPKPFASPAQPPTGKETEPRMPRAPVE